jgi:uncharacterized metal-binding protein
LLADGDQRTHPLTQAVLTWPPTQTLAESSEAMPSGRTHDLTTAALSIPTFFAANAVTGSFRVAAVFTAAFLFGGLMFGPDLDTASTQYSRWSIFRFIWLPYRAAFPHRSSWTHGLVISTIFRLVYFMGIVTLVSYLSALAVGAYGNLRVDSLMDFSRAWQGLGVFATKYIGITCLIAAIIGLWAGSAAHTLADLIFTYVKTGRVMRLF